MTDRILRRLIYVGLFGVGLGLGVVIGVIVCQATYGASL